jgi:hypothetical protein
MFHDVDWYLATDVFGQTVGLIFKGQADQEQFFLGCLILEDGLTRKDGKY